MLHRMLISELELSKVVVSGGEVEHVAGEGDGRAAEAELGVVGAIIESAAKRHVKAVDVHHASLHIEIGNPVQRQLVAAAADAKGS